MQHISDFDLEEIECRLYSQVFHSKETWESTVENEVINKIPDRQVSTFSISNIGPIVDHRYWVPQNNIVVYPLNTDNDKTPENSNTIVENNSHILESIIPLITHPVAEPEEDKKQLTRKARNIKRKEKRKEKRLLLKEQRALRKSLKRQGINNNNVLNNSGLNHQQIVNKIEIQCVSKDNAVIILSDSDNDSVIEIPLSPVPVYCLDTSYESSDSEEFEKSPKPGTSNFTDLDINEIKVHPTINTDEILPISSIDLNNQNMAKDDDEIIQNHIVSIDQINDNIIPVPAKEIIPISGNKNMSNKSNYSIKELEKERNDLLFTPDSNTNDFIENDVNNFSKNSFSFNFNLHEADLNLTANEFAKPGPSTTDVYETESSCSEAGLPLKNRSSFFNEVDFESPTKEIFCESDLSKFSNFITPIRNKNDRKTIKSNSAFNPILTKANKIDNKRKSSTSDDVVHNVDYNSDSTIVAVKKKTKTKKKKKEKKKKDKSPDNTDEIIPISKTPPTSTTVTDYYSKTDTYFADDYIVMTSELEKNELLKSSSPILEIQQNDNSTENEITVDDEIKNFSFMDAWRKSGSTQTSFVIDVHPSESLNQTSLNQITIISSDNSSASSEICVTDDKTATDMVLNLSNQNIEATQQNVENSEGSSSCGNFVANPFSFLKKFDEANIKKGFSKLWTNDMVKFYDDSWGHENYDLELVQQSMPSASSKWRVIPADIYHYTNRKRGPMCLRCREFGHMQYNCSKIKGPTKCSTCGAVGHLYTRCPESICTTCRNMCSHHTTSCRKCIDYKNLQCSICGFIGHQPRDCPDLWRRYHLTTNNSEKLVKPKQKLKPANQRWCSNCAQRGHLDDQCSWIRREHFPNNPQIVNYDSIYHKVPKIPPVTYEPNIPVIGNVNLTDLRSYKDNIMHNNNKKYINLARKIRKICNKDDCHIIERLDYLENAAKQNRFDKRKIGELYKLRSKIEKNMCR